MLDVERLREEEGRRARGGGEPDGGAESYWMRLSR